MGRVPRRPAPSSRPRRQDGCVTLRYQTQLRHISIGRTSVSDVSRHHIGGANGTVLEPLPDREALPLDQLLGRLGAPPMKASSTRSASSHETWLLSFVKVLEYVQRKDAPSSSLRDRVGEVRVPHRPRGSRVGFGWAVACRCSAFPFRFRFRLNGVQAWVGECSGGSGWWPWWRREPSGWPRQRAGRR